MWPNLCLEQLLKKCGTIFPLHVIHRLKQSVFGPALFIREYYLKASIYTDEDMRGVVERCRASLCNFYPPFPVCVCTGFVVVLWSHALEDSLAVAERSFFFFLITAQPGPARDHCARVLQVPTMELLGGEQWVKFLTVPHRFRGQADK